MKFFALVLLSLQASANQPFATLEKAQGTVFFDNRNVSQGYRISKPGLLRTGRDGRVKVAFPGKETRLILIENGEIQIVPPNPKSPGYTLNKGICRWEVRPQNKRKKWIKIRTRGAVMGVRGTDFLAVYNEPLGETEIVVFRGEVEFQNKAHEQDREILRQGQWGGIGGRFGSKIGRILDLPSAALRSLRRPTEL